MSFLSGTGLALPQPSGFELFVANASRRHEFLYGLTAVVLSLGLGWAAAAAFRRRL